MTQLVGILNLTPDSFSDGGLYPTGVSMLNAALEMADAGGAVIDVGAESTRPGAVPLSAEEEWVRLKPFTEEALPKCLARGIIISIDTRHAATAARILALGVHWINDVSGFADPAMVAAVQASDCKLVVMHSLTAPADPTVVLPSGEDVVAHLLSFAQKRIETLIRVGGIRKERIIFDPGIGFGKTAEQSWEIIDRIDELKVLGVPLLVGHSRKSFLKARPIPAVDLDTQTFAVSAHLLHEGVDYLRVHNVKDHTVLLHTLEET